VALVEVHVLHAQPAERRVELLADLRGGEASAAVRHREVGLRRQHVRAARPACEHLAQELLGGAARVDVGGVDEVHPGIEGAAHARLGLLARTPPP
jgi:hypothetical protein